MAPEIHMKASYYHGIMVDLFACGIILFIFHSGHPPFNVAKPKDSYYNMICTNRHDKFWEAHSKKKPENFYSEEFKSLINGMLSFDPTQRPSIAEIIAHPWFTKETATPEQIFEEFKGRKMKVDETVEKEKIAEQKKKEQQKMAAQNQNANFMFEAMGPAFRAKRDLNENEVEAFDSLWNEIETKFSEMNISEKMQKYKKGNNKPGTTYWSALTPKSFFETCYYVAEKIGNSTKPNVEKFKITVTKTLDEGKLVFDVKLYLDEGNYSVCEFIKKEGPLMEFYSVCDSFKQELEKQEGKGLEIEAEMVKE